MEGIPVPVLILKASANANFSRVTWDPENGGRWRNDRFTYAFPLKK
jgi:hypothetical protein